jgi:hypothetical protein
MEKQPMEYQLRVCPSCEKGIIVPMYDWVTGHPEVLFIKAWCCTHCEDNRMLYQGSLIQQRVQLQSRQE